jgi:hypothetical protein
MKVRFKGIRSNRYMGKCAFSNKANLCLKFVVGAKSITHSKIFPVMYLLKGFNI